MAVAVARRLATPAWLRGRTRVAYAVVYLLIVALAAYAAVASPAFRTEQNLTNILQQSIILGLVAIGQTLVVLTGGIDFSVGATVKLSVLVGALVMDGSSGMIVPAVLACVALGAAIGLTNGLVITRLNAAPFIATFGMFGILRGIAFTISTSPVGSAPSSFLRVYDASVGPLSLSVIGAAVLWFLAWLLVARTPLGRRLYAVGGQPEVARLAGIKVNRVRLLVYVISGALAAVAGLYALARSGVGDPTAGDNLEFDSITAVALGGTSLFGGSGGIVGTLGGVLLLSLITNTFNVLQVSPWYQGMVKGAIILLAVAVYRAKR